MGSGCRRGGRRDASSVESDSIVPVVNPSSCICETQGIMGHQRRCQASPRRWIKESGVSEQTNVPLTSEASYRSSPLTGGCPCQTASSWSGAPARLRGGRRGRWSDGEQGNTFRTDVPPQTAASTQQIKLQAEGQQKQVQCNLQARHIAPPHEGSDPGPGPGGTQPTRLHTSLCGTHVHVKDVDHENQHKRRNFSSEDGGGDVKPPLIIIQSVTAAWTPPPVSSCRDTSLTFLLLDLYSPFDFQ